MVGTQCESVTCVLQVKSPAYPVHTCPGKPVYYSALLPQKEIPRHARETEASVAYTHPDPKMAMPDNHRNKKSIPWYAETTAGEKNKRLLVHPLCLLYKM